MHELSIARAVLAEAEDAARAHGADRIAVLRLRIGALSGVVPEALSFAWEIAAEGSLAEGSRLEIERVPVAVHCPACDAERELPTVTRFRCPVCDLPTGAIVRGRELELASIEIAEVAA